MIHRFWHRLVHGIRKVSQHPDWTVIFGEKWPEQIMQVDVTDDFHAKQGRSTGRMVQKANGQQLAVYLKRHYRLAWWTGVLATLFPGRNWSPALQECTHLEWAKKHGFLVPEPVASAEYIGPWFRLQSMLAVRELTDMLPLHQAIPLAAKHLTPCLFEKWKKHLITELARLARALHRLRHYHKDFYLCHFYLSRGDIENWNASWAEGFRGRLYMIDFHRLGHHRFTWPVWQLKDLSQLLYSSDVDGVTHRDRVLFWRLYRDGKRRSWSLRLAEWCIRLKWQRYCRHNQKRKQQTKLAEPKQNRTAA